MKYHVFRQRQPFSEPENTAVECIRCGAKREEHPSATKLAETPCPTSGQWKPPSWHNPDGSLIEGATARKGGMATIAKGTNTLSLIEQQFGLSEAGMTAVKKDLDWMSFYGLIETQGTVLKVTYLGYWTYEELAKQIGIKRPVRQPTILTTDEKKRQNSARSIKAYAQRRNGQEPRQNTNRDLLVALLHSECVTAARIDPLADAITKKFSMRLKK